MVFGMVFGKSHLFGLIIVSSLVVSCGGSDDGSDSIVGGGDRPTASPNPTSTPDGAVPTATPTPSSTATPSSPLGGKLEPLDCGAPRGAMVNNRMDREAKEYMLCKHNEGRSAVALGIYMGHDDLLPVATNMQRLTWDESLEQVAQNYADNCVWEHNPNRGSEYNLLSPTDAQGNLITRVVSVGENIAVRTTRTSGADIEAVRWGYEAFENEGQFWEFGSINGSEVCHEEPCGHFTQVIWASTYKVGCAASYCQAGLQGFSGMPSTFLVCNYASAGNFIGREPYLTSDDSDDVCSQAVDGQTECANGLTSLPDYSTGL